MKYRFTLSSVICWFPRREAVIENRSAPSIMKHTSVYQVLISAEARLVFFTVYLFIDFQCGDLFVDEGIAGQAKR